MFRRYERSPNGAGVAEFARSFTGGELFDYAGGASPRTPLGGGAYTSTEYPETLELALHNELSYSAVYPRYLFFECVTAAETGGETTLGDSRLILEKMPREVVAELDQKGIRYERNLSDIPGDGYSWQEAFGTNSRGTVLERCRACGASAEFLADGTLRISQSRPVTIRHPDTGAEVWFNQVAGFHSSNIDPETRNWLAEAGMRPRLETTFADGSPIPDGLVDEIRIILKRAAVRLEWQPGDVLIVDNILAAHGRMPFTGPRQIALAMSR